MALSRLFGGTGAGARRSVQAVDGCVPATAKWTTDHWLVTAPTASGDDRRWLVRHDDRVVRVQGHDDAAEAAAVEELFAGPERVQVTVRPAALLLFVLFAWVAALVHGMWLDPFTAAWHDPVFAEQVRNGNLGPREVAEAFFRGLAVADWAAAWLWGSAVAAVTTACVAIHELGHAAAARLVGHRWVSLSLGVQGAAVRCLPAPTGWDQIVRAAAGPVAHLAVSLLLLAAMLLESPGPIWRLPNLELRYTVLWVPGLIGVGIAVSNLIPIRAIGPDGARILQGIRTLLADRSRRTT